MLDPYPLTSFAHVLVQWNRIEVIPKTQTGKWKLILIMDLVYPLGYSVNNTIDHAHCSLAYTTVEKVARRTMTFGRGTLMAKVDIEAAHFLIPVHGHNRPLLSLLWEDSLFVDPMLPFGLRSATKY